MGENSPDEAQMGKEVPLSVLDRDCHHDHSVSQLLLEFAVDGLKVVAVISGVLVKPSHCIDSALFVAERCAEARK